MTLTIDQLQTTLSQRRATDHYVPNYPDNILISKALRAFHQTSDAPLFANVEVVKPCNTFMRIYYIFRVTIEHAAFHHTDFWKPFAFTISMISLGWIAVYSLREKYNNFLQRKIEEWTTYAKDYEMVRRLNGLTVYRRQATYLDFMPDYPFYCRLGCFTYVCATLFSAAVTFQAAKYSSVWKVSVIHKRQNLIDECSNVDEDGLWRDPISLDTIPKHAVKTPQTLHLAPYLFNLENFVHSLMNREAFSHPYTNSDFTPEERKIVLEHICNFYQIEETTFLRLWEHGKATPLERKNLIKNNRDKIYPTLRACLEISFFLLVQQFSLDSCIERISSLSLSDNLKEVKKIENKLKDRAHLCFEEIEASKSTTKFHLPTKKSDLFIPIYLEEPLFLIPGYKKPPPPPIPLFIHERRLSPLEQKIWTYFKNTFDWNLKLYATFNCGEEKIRFDYRQDSIFLYHGFINEIRTNAIKYYKLETNENLDHPTLQEIEKILNEINPFMEHESEKVFTEAAHAFYDSYAEVTGEFKELLKEFEQDKRYRLFQEKTTN